MSMGLPVIGFKSCPAVNELIVDGVNGILCDDGTENFAKALETLINDEELRGVYGMRGREDMRVFSAENIYAEWEMTLQKVTTM